MRKGKNSTITIKILMIQLNNYNFKIYRELIDFVYTYYLIDKNNYINNDNELF